jgi:hypothetical protein
VAEKTYPHSRHRWFRVLLGGALALALLGSIFLYSQRFDHPVLYYHGASPEVVQGTVVAILNPFRERKDESNAEWLIRDLRTDKCEQIARERLGADPARICPVLRRSTKASLIWLDAKRDHSQSRELFYDMPESKSRLVIVFGYDESGWGVKTISLLR